jgi:2-dehydro-3-deoxygluconokinase
MLDLVTLGETMLRLSSPATMRLEQTAVLNVDVAGAESNVAVALSRLGLQTGWVSRLTTNSLGRMVVNKIREHGVDVSTVLWTDEARVGTYYLEIGHTPRPNMVIYDRGSSAFSLIDVEEVNWDYVTDARILHLTGITPGLSLNCQTLVQQALEKARQVDQVVTFDLNYRAKIWSPDKAAGVLSKILPLVDILLCGREEVQTVFGMGGATIDMAAALRDRFGIDLVVLSQGEQGAIAFDGEPHVHDSYEIEVVDRVGAGDAFAAGFIFGYLYDGREMDQPEKLLAKPSGNVDRGLAYGMALAALKHTHHGDISWCTRKDMLDLVHNRHPGWR